MAQTQDGSADSARAIASPDSVPALPSNPAARAQRWALGAGGGWGWPSAGDLNERIALENLALAGEIPAFDAYAIAIAAMRYGLSEQVAIDLRGGYLWQTLDGGRVERKVSAIPFAAGLTVHPWRFGSSLRVGPFASGGVLIDATFEGRDPLGGVDYSGTGWLAEAGVEAEYALFGPSGTVRARGGGQLARVADLLGPGTDFDLDGFFVHLGFLYYLAP